MHIKRFEANSMEEALTEIKQVFGPDALILSSRTIRKNRRSLGLFSRERVEVQAAAPRRRDREDASADVGRPTALENERFRDSQGMDVLVAEFRSAIRGIAARQEFEEEIRGELRGLRFALDRRFGRSPGEGQTDAIEPAVARLMMLGLEWTNAEAVATQWREAQVEGDQSSIESFLDDRIEGRLLPPRPEERPSIRVLVGSPGVGKTTTLAKLATRNEEGEGEVALVSMDPYRIGAEAQLEQYAALLDTPFVSINEAAGLSEILLRYPRHRVLVDTAGRSRAFGDDLDSLSDLRDRSGRAVSIEWVVDATARLEVHRAQLERFKKLSPDRVILTKVDECEDLKGPLNLILSAGCPPLSWIGKGQRVPEDLEIAELSRFREGGHAWLQ